MSDLPKRLGDILAPVLAERAAAAALAEAERRWPTEQLLRIVTEIRKSQLIHDRSSWDGGVNATCDEFASQLLGFLGQLDEKRRAQIDAIHADYAEEYADCPNRYGLVYSEGK